MNYDNWKLESPYSNDPDNVQDCKKCSNYSTNINENGFCSTDCEDFYYSDLEYCLGCYFEEIDWYFENELNMSQLIYDKAHKLGLTNLCNEIELECREKNMKLNIKK